MTEMESAEQDARKEVQLKPLLLNRAAWTRSRRRLTSRQDLRRIGKEMQLQSLPRNRAASTRKRRRLTSRQALRRMRFSRVAQGILNNSSLFGQRLPSSRCSPSE